MWALCVNLTLFTFPPEFSVYFLTFKIFTLIPCLYVFCPCYVYKLISKNHLCLHFISISIPPSTFDDQYFPLFVLWILYKYKIFSSLIPIPKWSQRSSPTSLSQTHPFIPCSNINKVVSFTENTPAKHMERAPNSRRTPLLTHRPRLPENQIGSQ